MDPTTPALPFHAPHAVLLHGRLLAEDRTIAQLLAARDAVANAASTHGLPLVLVTTSGWNDRDGQDTTVFAPVFVGVALASAREGAGPVTIASERIAAPQIPAAVWELLEEHTTEPVEYVDDSFVAETGTFVLPTSWSAATLALSASDGEGQHLAGGVSKNSIPYGRVEDSALDAIRTAGGAQLVCRHI